MKGRGPPAVDGMPETVAYADDVVWILDQLRLPREIEYLECRTVAAVAKAIQDMNVRGAPAIGVTAAYGLALAARVELRESVALESDFAAACLQLMLTRPTAINLRWAVDRMRHRFDQLTSESRDTLGDLLLAEAHSIRDEDLLANKTMGANGSAVVPEGAHILTHCNAGSLATSGYGTAVGVIRRAHEDGKGISVWVDETRPYLQGARLTAFELSCLKIPYHLVADNMAGHLMSQGKVDLIVVGADRITANGDVANKIGTYSLAVLARYHEIPFYIAAPLSTIDLSLDGGEQIPIEERNSRELTHLGDKPLAPEDARAYNPAFDVTPSTLITGIITQRGIAKAPFGPSIGALFEGAA